MVEILILFPSRAPFCPEKYLDQDAAREKADAARGLLIQ
jgi:hypothetical protein